MAMTYARPRARIAVLTIVSLLASQMPPLLAQTTPATKAPAPAAKPPAATPTQPAAKPPTTTTASAATKPATTAAAKPAVPPPADGGWPHAYITPSGATLVIYQPQIADWPDQKHITVYAAISHQPKGQAQPTLGTIKGEADTSVALDARLVNLTNLKVTDPSFPTLNRDQMRVVVDDIVASVDFDDRGIGLDRVLANLDGSQIIPKNVEGVKADPPPIFHSDTPAILVNIDGEPILAPIPQNDLKTVVNTNWDLFQHDPTKVFYLRNNKMWLKATDVKGPWTPAGKLPDSFKKLPGDGNWKEVKDNLPGQSIKEKDVPRVFVSTVPAEMILLRGKPSYIKVQGADTLLWVNNTDSDVFRMGLDGPIYYLVAGRWFSSSSFDGPWTFVTPNLPPDFKKIPLEHDRSRVLASVPGTQQAAEAILIAQVPQTARVSKTLAAPEVTYQGGTAQFEPIEKTTVQRAVNTDKDILKVGDLYYMCFQGVWFMSTTPNGPWKVTGEVPKAIYDIPVSSPAHSVTYVIVEKDDDDEVAYATMAAYTGAMVAFGCVVWGSGYYYPPYYGFYGGYPYYYPHYPSYGFGASYNPWTGAYTRGAVAYGPYGGAGVAQRYNPRTGTYSRGAVAYGPYGARGAASAYNPRTGTSAATRQGSNVYGSWGATGVKRGDDWAATARKTNNVTGATTRRTATSNGGEAVSRSGAAGRTTVAKSGSGDVYAGHDGNVYRKGADGGVEKYNPGGGWSAAENPNVTRDSAARAEGAKRTADQGTMRSGGSTRTGSYRASSPPARSAPRAGGGGGRRR